MKRNLSLFFFFFFFFFFFCCCCCFGFMTLSRLFYLVRADHYQRWAKPEVPEKNHLTFRCRTWRLTCCRARLVPTAVGDLMIKSQRSYPLSHGSPKRYYLTDRNNMTYAFQDSRCHFWIKKNKNIKFLPFIKETEQKIHFFVSPPKNRL